MGCKTILNYLRNKDPNPKRYSAFNSVLDCNCIELAILRSYSNNFNEFSKYFRYVRQETICNSDFIEYDLVDKLNYNNNTIDKVNIRVDFLKSTQHILWHMGLKRAYEIYYENIFKYYWKSTIDKNIIIASANLWNKYNIIKSVANGILNLQYIDSYTDPNIILHNSGLYHLSISADVININSIVKDINIILNNKTCSEKHIKSLIHTNELDTGLLIGKTRSLKPSIKIFNNQNSTSIDINKYQPYDIVRYENDEKIYKVINTY
jgi:hypothetical protein